MKIIGIRAGRGRLAVLSAFLMLAGAAPAFAQVNSWTGGTGSWFTAGNWASGVPGVASAAQINNGGTAQVDGARATASIGTFNINGGSTVDVQSGSTLNATTINVGGGPGSAGTLLLSGNIFGGGTSTVSYTNLVVNNGTISVTGTGGAQLNAVVLTGTSNTFSASTTLQINGVVSGSGISDGVTIAGSNSVIYTTANTYSGGTTINSSSTLNLGNGSVNGDAGSGAIVNNGTIFLDHGSNAFLLSNAISGTGGLTIAATNSGSVSLSGGAKTYTGATTILGGTLIAGSATQLASTSTVAISSGAKLDILQNSPTLKNLTGAGTVLIDQNDIGANTLTLTSANFTGTITENPTGGGIPILGQNLVQAAGGTSVLAGTNSWTGTTTITAGGTLQFGNGGTGGNLPSGAITNNGTLIVNHSDNVTYAGVLSGGGVLSQTGTGTLTLTGANTFTGGTSITAGVVKFSSLGNFGTGAITLNGGTLQWASGTTTDISSKLTLTSGTLDTNGNNVTLASALTGTGGFIKAGAGTLTLTGANTYSGGTTIAGGTLSLGSSGAAGTGAIGTTGSVIDYANGISVANAIIINSATTQVQAGTGVTATQSGVISQTGGTRPLEKIGAGTLILTGTNTYTGATTVTAGTLQIGAGGTAGSIAGAVTDNATLAFKRSDAVTFAGVISGTGAVTQSGTGNLILTGTNTYTGATNVNSGTLSVNGSIAASAVAVASGGTLGGTGTVGATTVASGGTIAPGNSIGTINVSGNFTLNSGSTTAIEVSPTASDQVIATGTASIGGTLTASFASGPYTAKQYTLITSTGTLSGTFTTFTPTSVPSGFTASLSYDAHDVFLNLAAPAVVAPPAPPPAVFPAVTGTPNEIAAGTAIQAGGASSALYASLLNFSTTAAQAAFDATSGEIHASLRTALVEDDRIIRITLLDRLGRAGEGAGIWGAPFLNSGSVNSDGNAAKLRHNSAGFIAGYDMPLSAALRVGLAGAIANHSLTVTDRASRGSGTSGHVAAYGSWTDDALAVKFGEDYGWGSTTISRSVGFLSETDTSKQSHRTTQIFGDAGYLFKDGALTAEPYLDLAWVRAHTGAFTESGGTRSDLAGSARTNSATYSVIGVRFSPGIIPMGDSVQLRPRVDLGWQHQFGTFKPAQSEAFIATGTAFTVLGVPLGMDAATPQLGLDFLFAGGGDLSLDYDGVVSSKSQSHTVKAQLNWPL